MKLGQAGPSRDFDHAVDEREEGRGFGPNEPRSLDAVDIIRVGRDQRVVVGLDCLFLQPVGIRRGLNVIGFLLASALVV